MSSPVPFVGVKALPRGPVSSEIYMGDELRTTSSRPGAYDALQLPSLFNGRAVRRGELALEAAVQYMPPPPAPAPALPVRVVSAGATVLRKPRPLRDLTQGRISLSGYEPHPGSGPALVIAQLRQTGGHMPYVEISRRFGIQKTSITAIFKSAIKKSALVRHIVAGKVSLALPDFVPPPEEPFVAPAPKLPKGLEVVMKKLHSRTSRHCRPRSPT